MPSSDFTPAQMPAPESMLLVLLGVHPGVDFLGRVVILCLTHRGTATLSPTAAAPFYISNSSRQGLFSVCFFLKFSHSSVREELSPVALSRRFSALLWHRKGCSPRCGSQSVARYSRPRASLPVDKSLFTNRVLFICSVDVGKKSYFWLWEVRTSEHRSAF